MSFTKLTWKNLPDTTTPLNATNLNRIEQGVAEANGAVGTQLAQNTDLNNVTTIGSYYSAQGSDTTTMSHIPTGLNKAFKLIVEHLHRTDRILQTLIANDDKITIYRRINNGSWLSWEKMLTNNDTNGSMTYNSTYITETPDVNNYHRIGNVVQISFRGKLANSIPNGSKIVTLPFKSAHASMEITAFYGTQYSRTGFYNGYINSNGEVVSTSYSGNNNYLHMYFTYITNDD